jgi:hypothetical protein
MLIHGCAVALRRKATGEPRGRGRQPMKKKQQLTLPTLATANGRGGQPPLVQNGQRTRKHDRGCIALPRIPSEVANYRVPDSSDSARRWIPSTSANVMTGILGGNFSKSTPPRAERRTVILFRTSVLSREKKRRFCLIVSCASGRKSSRALPTSCWTCCLSWRTRSGSYCPR